MLQLLAILQRLFLEGIQHIPTSGPLHLQFLPPGTLSTLLHADSLSSFHLLCSLFKEAFADSPQTQSSFPQSLTLLYYLPIIYHYLNYLVHI